MPKLFENNDLFATPDSVESLTNWIEKFHGNERVIAMTAAGMALNLAGKLEDEANEKIKAANAEILTELMADYDKSAPKSDILTKAAEAQGIPVVNVPLSDDSE
jgi:hypothetical protein